MDIEVSVFLVIILSSINNGEPKHHNLTVSIVSLFMPQDHVKTNLIEEEAMSAILFSVGFYYCNNEEVDKLMI